MKRILKIKRGNIVEREHVGSLILCDEQKILLSYGCDDANRCYYLRSCAKPLQASVLADLGVFEFFDFSQEEIAVVSASHIASFDHVATIEGILKKIGKSHYDFKCGIHAPLSLKTREYLVKNDLQPNQLHNNCSGKHAGFLSACIKQGWNTSNYTDFDHPLQKLMIEKMENYCGFEPKYLSKDGCSAPIMAMPLKNMCIGFLKGFQNYPQIQSAFANNPYMIGGEGRIDSEIIFASNGRLLSKVGAEGLCMVYNSEKSQVLLVEISDSDEQARAVVLIEALRRLEWISDEEIANNPLEKLFKREVKTIGGDVVGEIIPTFSFEEACLSK